MKSQATTVEQYINELPDDRRPDIVKVRQAILDNLPKGYEEVMAWGMITYQVPFDRFSETYNKKPLMYAALANQKNYMAIYTMTTYAIPELKKELEDGFRQAGKKLDMGSGCIRFKSIDDLPLEVIAKTIASRQIDEYIDFYEKNIKKPKKS